MKNESKVIGSADPVSMICTEKILNQMKNCVCKIKFENSYGTGFFCKISDINMNFLMTNYHVIQETYVKESDKINILLNDEKEALIIDLTIKREKYFNEQFDITLIEIKENDNIKEYLELDDNILKDHEKIYYEKKSIYILHYFNGKNICVSYGLLNSINQYNIIHRCSTDYGSSGSPILNIENNKLIGIHSQGAYNLNETNYNKGILLKYPLNDIIQKYNNNIILNEIIINKDEINKDKKININKIDNNLKNVLNDNIINISKNKNIIKGMIDINSNKIYNIIKFFNTDNNNDIDILINNEKINVLKDNNEWKYKFDNKGKYIFEIIFNNNINNMKQFFEKCSNIISLDFSYFNSSNITNMSWMFNNCNKLKEIKGINKLNTSKVTNMYAMFNECYVLGNLDLSNFITNNVINISWMFNKCYKLKEIKGLNKFNTNKVTDMSGMFQECEVLENIDLSNFNTDNVNNLSWMFNKCNKLKEIKGINKFNTSKVSDMKAMFQKCNLLE